MPVPSVDQQLFAVRQPGVELLVEKVVNLVVAEVVRRAMWMYEQTTDNGRPPFQQPLTRLEQERLLATATPEQQAQWEAQTAAIPDPRERAKAQAEVFRAQALAAMRNSGIQQPAEGPGRVVPQTMLEQLAEQSRREQVRLEE
mgnify:CR=1 FL=1